MIVCLERETPGSTFFSFSSSPPLFIYMVENYCGVGSDEGGGWFRDEKKLLEILRWVVTHVIQSNCKKSWSFHAVLKFLCHQFVQRYIVLLKQSLPGDGYITSLRGWRDLTLELTGVEKLDEIQACQILLMVASNIFTRGSGGLHFLTLKDVGKLHVYEWERSLIQ